MTQQLPRQQRRALERATAKTLHVGGDPAAAAELDELRRVRQGAYGLMHVLVSRMGGTEAKPIEIARGEWQTLPPLETLKVKIDPATNDVKLYIEKQKP